MAKLKNIPNDAPSTAKPSSTAKSPTSKAAPPKVQSHAFRETVESIVIAFVLAFLFRTFEAEAFVIPTGSMAPTLMGRHKDVDCPKCGYRYTVSASEEESDDPNRRPSDCIAGMCPMCHYVLPMVPNLPGGNRNEVAKQPSYNGDRILVNKYLYTFTDPERWDVVVFKFPGDAKINYIKRLVGLPGESLKIYQGDIFIRPSGSNHDADYKIERKPADKFLAMRQLVHDTEHDPAQLDAAGWPLRWHAPPGDANKWQVEKAVEGNIVRQKYNVDATGDSTTWLRYEHLIPNAWPGEEVWNKVLDPQASPPPSFANVDRAKLRRLITDSNPYNGRVDRFRANPNDPLDIEPVRQGLHWVGDLMVEADVDIQSGGELLLDVVEGGKHFGCRVDLKTGEAKLSIPGQPELTPTVKTALVAPGKHHVGFANVDDQLLLWVDGTNVKFDGGAAYDVAKVFGKRENILPQTSAQDLGDLAPAGIGAHDAKLTVTRLQVWRDLYYIADRWDLAQGAGVVSDFHPLPANILRMQYDPSTWDEWRKRDHVEFNLNNDQLFVMGDNSAESSDARLWLNERNGGHPGGAYLDRRLLIGKALCVYWPHSWNQIPGTPIPFPLFPNVQDMRLVR
ncbi:MAG: signal peptidase I [Pirellulales bacterium]